MQEKPLHGSRNSDEPLSSLWTLHMLRLYGILLLGYLCIVLQGYDGALMTSINAMVSRLGQSKQIKSSSFRENIGLLLYLQLAPISKDFPCVSMRVP